MRVSSLPAIIKRQIPTAPLPLNYEAAKIALKACVDVDEAKEWADRATAIASYARQIQDRSLHDLAKRVELRAIRRLGELIGDDAGPARELGMTKWRIRGARKIAALPLHEFEAAIENPRVPSFSEFSNTLIKSSDGAWHEVRSKQTEHYRQMSHMLDYMELRIKEMPSRVTNEHLAIGSDGQINREEGARLRPRIV